MKTLLSILCLLPTLALAAPMTATEFEACLNSIPCLTAYNRGQAFHMEREPARESVRDILAEELDARMLGLHPLSFPRTRVPFLGLYPLTPLAPQPFYLEPVPHW